jgi:putative sigma-54 modulation protein
MHRSASDAHIAEVTLVIDGRTLRSHAAGISYQAALDDVVDKVERQAVDFKSKPRLRARPEEEKRILRDLADGTAEPGHDRRVVKTKRFAIEPMFEEDAVAAMDELGHQFFVFVNAETEKVAILYARNDGDLGMIEPIVGGEYTKGHDKSNGRRR